MELGGNDMQQNNMDFTAMARLLATPEGKQLIAVLQRDGGKTLQQAMALAAAGKTQEAVALLRPLTQTGEAADLLEKINGRR